jgi:hypothetical protein
VFRQQHDTRLIDEYSQFNFTVVVCSGHVSLGNPGCIIQVTLQGGGGKGCLLI